MVVGGLPQRSTTHAECVANQALDMMYYSRRVCRPDNGSPITVSLLPESVVCPATSVARLI